MTTTRCEKCVGKKTLIGMGSMIIKCPGCNGVGHVKIEEEKKEDEVKSIKKHKS